MFNVGRIGKGILEGLSCEVMTRTLDMKLIFQAYRKAVKRADWDFLCLENLV